MFLAATLVVLCQFQSPALACSSDCHFLSKQEELSNTVTRTHKGMYGSETHPIPSRNKSSKSRMISLVGKNENQSQVCNKENKNNVSSPPAVTKVHFQSKRQGYLSWDDYFLAVALLSSKRSKDPKSPSGACIVDQHNRIVGKTTSSHS